ncbi:TadE/TadG family type IV pilus assembly protein [Streptomyces sp. NPDC055709]
MRIALVTDWRDDRGQTAVEFTGMVPIILATLILLWQAALVGYTFSLAGNAADEGARAGAVAGLGSGPACEAAARKKLPDAWQAGDTHCQRKGSGLFEARVDLKAPFLFPGFVDLPIPVDGRASAVWED